MISGNAVADWRALAATVVPRDRLYVEGAFVDSSDAGRFETVNPSTGEAICSLPIGCVADVDGAVRSARAAFEDGRWRDLPLQQRKGVLLAIADLIDANADELALLDSLEMGKAITNARAEIAMSTSIFRYFAEAMDKLYGQVAPTDPGALAISTFEPRGVVGAIVAWNFPLANAAMKIAPALAAGNALVLKPSEIASLSALRLAELGTQAGLPPGILNVLPGLGTTVGEAIARHMDVDFLSFTGSTGVGRRLMHYAGVSNGKPLMIECGGKSPNLVCADMEDEIDALAARIVHDAFWNQGQWCAARTRLIVEESFYEPLLAAVVEKAARLVPGDPLDPSANFGTLASAAQFQRVQDYIASGIEDGARLAFQGGNGTPCATSAAPTIFGEVTSSMRICREEIFGPVLCAAPARDFDNAVASANETEYGLGATVWTRDARKIQLAMRSIRAGKIMIRTTTTATGGSGLALAAEPRAASGFGPERGMEGLRSYCRIRGVEVI